MRVPWPAARIRTVGETVMKLGGRDSNPDSQDQNLMSCHWTTPQGSAHMVSRELPASHRERFPDREGAWLRRNTPSSSVCKDACTLSMGACRMPRICVALVVVTMMSVGTVATSVAVAKTVAAPCQDA